MLAVEALRRDEVLTALIAGDDEALRPHGLPLLAGDEAVRLQCLPLLAGDDAVVAHRLPLLTDHDAVGLADGLALLAHDRALVLHGLPLRTCDAAVDANGLPPLDAVDRPLAPQLALDGALLLRLALLVDHGAVVTAVGPLDARCLPLVTRGRRLAALRTHLVFSGRGLAALRTSLVAHLRRLMARSARLVALGGGRLAGRSLSLVLLASLALDARLTAIGSVVLPALGGHRRRGEQQEAQQKRLGRAFHGVPPRAARWFKGVALWEEPGAECAGRRKVAASRIPVSG